MDRLVRLVAEPARLMAPTGAAREELFMLARRLLKVRRWLYTTEGGTACFRGVGVEGEVQTRHDAYGTNKYMDSS